MTRLPIRLLFTLLLLLPLAACDSTESDDENGNGDGTTVGDASVTVSGDVDASFDGSAYFVEDPEGEEGFGLVLFDGTTISTVSQSGFVVLGREGDRPAPGTYTIDEEDVDDNFSGGYVNFTDAGNASTSVIIAAESGTLDVTSSTDERVAGSFTFTGRVFDPSMPTDSTRTATVTGDFEADFLEEGDLPDASF